MKEASFVNRNKNRWLQFESSLNSPQSISPNDLSDLFVSLSDDLAFARTFYPESPTTRYLNQLVFRAHLILTRNKRTQRRSITLFWKKTFPLLVYSYRKTLLWAVLIFAAGIGIGWLSSANDSDYVRVILGDYYVDMTEQNIRDGNPLAVYKSMNEADMFLGITLNNIMVSFYAFIFGMIISIGTGYILFTNGVMIGVFHQMFFEKGLLGEALGTIWIHGTLEIFAILVAGTAGIVLGNSFLFPGTYSRGRSFRIGATNGVKMLIGLIPVFIVAGFIEGFITRYTHAHIAFRGGIILLSAIFIVWYFFIHPSILLKKEKNEQQLRNI